MNRVFYSALEKRMMLNDHLDELLATLLADVKHACKDGCRTCKNRYACTLREEFAEEDIDAAEEEEGAASLADIYPDGFGYDEYTLITEKLTAIADKLDTQTEMLLEIRDLLLGMDN